VAVEFIGPKAKTSSAGRVIAGMEEQPEPVPTTAASTKKKAFVEEYEDEEEESKIIVEVKEKTTRRKSFVEIKFMFFTFKEQVERNKD
jgi:hypothetical protein